MPTPDGRWWPLSWQSFLGPDWRVNAQGSTDFRYRMQADGRYYLGSDTAKAILGDLAGTTVNGEFTDDGLNNAVASNYAVPAANSGPVFINEFYHSGTTRKYELAGPVGQSLSGWKVARYRENYAVLSHQDTITYTSGAVINADGVYFNDVAFNAADTTVAADPCRALALINPAGVVVEFIDFVAGGVAATGGAVTTGPASGKQPTTLQNLTGTGLSYSRKGSGPIAPDHKWEKQAATLGTLNTGQALVAQDLTPPPVPTGLAAGAVTAHEVPLSWSIAGDAATYRVRRDGTIVGNPSTVSFTDTQLTANTEYSYTVSSLDAAGNESAQSAAVVVTTLVESTDPPPDPDPDPTDPYMTSGQSVAAFMGQGDNPDLVAQAQKAVDVIRQLVHAYTRGKGHPLNAANDDLEAVITTASARLVANPEQLDTTVGGVRTGAGFSGWTLAETFVLNRYRKRAS